MTLKTHPKAGFSEEMQILRLNFPNSNSWPVPRAVSGITLPEAFNARANRASNPGSASFAGAPGEDHRKINQLIGHHRDYRRVLIQQNDVVRSVEIDPTGPTRGDYRLVAGRFEVPATYYRPHPDYHGSGEETRHAQSLRDDRFAGLGMFGWNGKNDTPADEILTNDPSRPSNQSTTGRLVPNAQYGPIAAPIAANDLNGAIKQNGRLGDWETGLGILPDGPFVRRNYEASSRMDNFIKNDSSYYLYGYYYHDNAGTDFAPQPPGRLRGDLRGHAQWNPRAPSLGNLTLFPEPALAHDRGTWGGRFRGSLRVRLAPRSPPSRSLLDAGGRALRHQRALLHGGKR